MCPGRVRVELRRWVGQLSCGFRKCTDDLMYMVMFVQKQEDSSEKEEKN